MTSCLCRRTAASLNRKLGKLCKEPLEEELRKREGSTNSFFLFNNSHLSTELGFGGSVNGKSGDL